MGDTNKEQLTVPEDHMYLIPDKAIKTFADMPTWEKSEAYLEYLGFVCALNDAIRGKPSSVDCSISKITQNLVSLLEKLEKNIEICPPAEQPQRFGNVAFREWSELLRKNSLSLLQEALPQTFHRCIPEIKLYLEESFGNSTRIDYGTGHEISFVMFLCCFYKIGALVTPDRTATVCVIFKKYLELVRQLQKIYRMEPAGSHGVWSLDDYQFLPFVWGSSQLIGHHRILPSKFLDVDVIEKFSNEYLFLSCIKYIKEVKSGPFPEHSNQLWGISAVSDWIKINQGLIKMYKKEVLGKFPVVQHILFGSLLPIRPMVSRK